MSTQLDLILDKLLHIVLPATLASALLWMLLSRFKLAGLAFLAGFLSANYFCNALSWYCHEDMGLLLTMLTVASVASAMQSDKWFPNIMLALVVTTTTAVLFAADSVPPSHTFLAAAYSLLLYVSLWLAEKNLPRLLPACLALLGLATAIVMIHAHSARLCDLGLMTMASFTGICSVTLLKKTHAYSLAAPTAVFFPYLIFYGQQNTFSEVPWFAFAFLAIAPLACLMFLYSARHKIRLVAVLLWCLMLALAVAVGLRYETVVMM